MVLISVNAVLGLLKRSTCIRDRTHLVVCRYLPVGRIDAEPQSRRARLWLVIIIIIIIIVKLKRYSYMGIGKYFRVCQNFSARGVRGGP